MSGPGRVVDHPLGLRSQGPEFKSPSGRFLQHTPPSASEAVVLQENATRRFEHDRRSATAGSDRLSAVQISVRTFPAAHAAERQRGGRAAGKGMRGFEPTSRTPGTARSAARPERLGSFTSPSGRSRWDDDGRNAEGSRSRRGDGPAGLWAPRPGCGGPRELTSGPAVCSVEIALHQPSQNILRHARHL